MENIDNVPKLKRALTLPIANIMWILGLSVEPGMVYDMFSQDDMSPRAHQVRNFFDAYLWGMKNIEFKDFDIIHYVIKLYEKLQSTTFKQKKDLRKENVINYNNQNISSLLTVCKTQDEKTSMAMYNLLTDIVNGEMPRFVEGFDINTKGAQFVSVFIQTAIMFLSPLEFFYDNFCIASIVRNCFSYHKNKEFYPYEYEKSIQFIQLLNMMSDFFRKEILPLLAMYVHHYKTNPSAEGKKKWIY